MKKMSDKGLGILFVVCVIMAGVGAHSVATTLPPPMVVYATADGDFDVVGIYARGESKDYMKAEIHEDGEAVWFDNSFSNHNVFKVFVVINGTTYGPREINLVTGTPISVEEAGVTVTIVEDSAPQGYVDTGAWCVIVFVTIFGGIGLWLLLLFVFERIENLTKDWRKKMKNEYGYEMGLPYPTARRERRIPIEGRWWIKMINVKLGRDEKVVFE